MAGLETEMRPRDPIGRIFVFGASETLNVGRFFFMFSNDQLAAHTATRLGLGFRFQIAPGPFKSHRPVLLESLSKKSG